MRVIIGPTLRPSISSGWARVFEACGHSATIWEPLAKPAFDVFDEVEPHLFIRTLPDDRATSKCVAARPHMKVVDQFDPKPAGDTFLFGPGDPDPNLICDFAYIGGYRPDKEALLNSYLLPLAAEGSLKIFGRGPWPVPEYLGPVTDETARLIYCSAKLCIDVPSTDRPHDRQYNIMLCEAVCVDYNWPQFITGETASRKLNPDQFRKTIRYLLNERRSGFLQNLRKDFRHIVLSESTYWHRVQDILRSAGLYGEADRVAEVYGATVKL